MDSLRYFYKSGTNQLDYIRDKNSGSTAHSSNYGATVDIKDQASGNYVYNAIGELNYDRISAIDSVKWNVYGKMQHIYKHSATYGTQANGLHYYYDPSGNRTGMAVLYNPSSYNEYTWYVRDAQGNVMAVYKANGASLSTITLKLREHYIYGSSRLGVINRNMDVDQPRLTPDNGNANLGTAYLATFTRGDKLFEFTNHLGNVLFTATDGKVPKAQTGNPSLVGSYSVSMVTAVDYTPFGMIMQGMNYGSAAPGKYRYGFNGKEWENSTKGNADQIDYGERMYDNRAGRFLSVDKLTKQFSYYSPYQFAGNTPIWANDLDGKEPNFIHRGNGIYGIGLFSEGEWGSLRRHDTKLTIGKGDKQFQIEWLVSANGDPLGYLASRIIPEEEYKRLYGGTGKGLQPAYIIEPDKFGDFGSNLDKYYDYSHQAELYDVLWGEIDRDPVKRLFDPRGWLLGEVGGAAGNLALDFFKMGILRYGKLTNTETRVWYNMALSKINTKVAFTEENAKIVSAERNAAKQTARLLMKDRAAAAKLDETDPIRDFDYYKNKYSQEGYEGESLWKKIIEGSTKPNADVNRKFGIK